ncbi:hypothetical protein [Naumannella huperziae]
MPPELAERVAGHLLMAGQLVDTDPDEARRHTEVARRHAARLPVVREAAAETAYAAGDYSAALQDFRTLRRMTGSEEYLPVIADCLRALGKPEDALDVARDGAGRPLDPATRIELRIVEAGARADLGQRAEARRLLRTTWDREARAPAMARARLAYAVADLFAQEDNPAQARAWFARAAETGGDATDAEERLDPLGLELDDGPEPEADEPAGPARPDETGQPEPGQTDPESRGQGR